MNIQETEHVFDSGYATAFRVEAKPDGLHICQHEPGKEPRAYQDNFMTIPVEILPWFVEAITLAANRSPLFRSQ